LIKDNALPAVIFGAGAWMGNSYNLIL